jgi:hypothetical protein
LEWHTYPAFSPQLARFAHGRLPSGSQEDGYLPRALYDCGKPCDGRDPERGFYVGRLQDTLLALACQWSSGVGCGK